MPRSKAQAVANLAVHFRRLQDDPEYRAEFRRRVGESNRSPERRAKSSATARAVNARRVRCEECGMVSSPAGISRHQNLGGHRGRSAVGLTVEGRRRQREAGRRGQTRHARRWADDPDYRERVSTALSEAMTPERRADNAERMRELQRRRYECADCGYVSTASNVSRHQSKENHAGRSMIAT